MLYFNRNGVWFTIPIAKDAIYSRELLERQIHTSLLGLQNLKDRSGELDQMRFEKPGEYVIKSVFGRDDILIYPSIIQKKDKEPMRIKNKDEATMYQYVLLVELNDNPDGLSPGGFAVFEPSKTGEGPNGTGVVNLRFAGWTNIITANQDPLGIVGQATFRAGWCNSAITTDIGGVEQVKRIDQGYCAYHGDAYAEESTMLEHYINLHSYNDIDYPTHWESVDPGPPPAAICGYTWSIEPTYGGTSGDADYHDERHLFYRVDVGNDISYWWPPEFNQKLVIKNYYRNQAAVFSALVYNSGSLDNADLVGLDAALGTDLCLNTFSNVYVTYEDSKRIWGILWGNTTYYAEDRDGSSDFPYTTFPEYKLTNNELQSEYFRNAIGYGVYVFGYASTIFLNGMQRSVDANSLGASYPYKGTERETKTIEEFVSGTTLTARQLELMVGNEDILPYVPNIYTGLKDFTFSRLEYACGEVIVNCSGSEYFIFPEELLDDEGNKITGDFFDHGIFTKKGTGFDSSGNIDVDSISPIYAYSTRKYSTLDGFVAGDKFIYGMVLDGLHYRTDEFVCDANGYVDIPGCAGAKNISGAQIRATRNVRVGVKITKIAEESEIEIDA